MHIHVSVRVSRDQLAKSQLFKIPPLMQPSLDIQAGGGKELIKP